MVERKFITNTVRDYLKKNKLLDACIRCATDLEQLLTEKLFFEKKIEFNLIEKWTLGKLVQWNFSLGLIDKKYKPLLNQFNTLRNKIVHRRIFFEGIRKDHAAKLLLKGRILSICNFIDNTSIEYESTQKIEEEYGKLLKKSHTHHRNL